MIENELPKRKKARLSGYDYSSSGAYFVTVCVQDRKPIFWDNVDQNKVGADNIRPQNVPLSQYGYIVNDAIASIQESYPAVYVDCCVIMPEHVHLILLFSAEDGRMISAPTLSTVIGQFKRIVSKRIGFPIWQKSYFDHIIRDNDDYRKHKNYILDNPRKRLLEEDFSKDE